MSFFTYGFEKRAAERLVGGKADGKPDSAFPKDQLRMGRKVEREHTKDPKAANEVAKDHLTEDSKYYTHLKEMEDKYVKTAFVSGFEKKAISVERVQRVIRSRMQGSPIKDELVGAFMGLSSRSSKMQPAERALAKKSIQEVQAAVPNLGRKGPLPEPKTPMDFFEQNYKQLQKDKALAPTYKEIDEYVAKQKEKDPFNVKFLKEGFEKRAGVYLHITGKPHGVKDVYDLSYKERVQHMADADKPGPWHLEYLPKEYNGMKAILAKSADDDIPLSHAEIASVAKSFKKSIDEHFDKNYQKEFERTYRKMEKGELDNDKETLYDFADKLNSMSKDKRYENFHVHYG